MMIMATILTDDNDDAWGSDNGKDDDNDEDDNNDEDDDTDEDTNEQHWPVTISKANRQR